MRRWLRRLFGQETQRISEGEASPTLLMADGFADHDIGELRWNLEHNRDLLTFTNDGRTAEWHSRQRAADEPQLAWVAASTCLRLHSGRFRWDFVVDEMASRQIGIGFML